METAARGAARGVAASRVASSAPRALRGGRPSATRTRRCGAGGREEARRGATTRAAAAPELADAAAAAAAYAGALDIVDVYGLERLTSDELADAAAALDAANAVEFEARVEPTAAAAFAAVSGVYGVLYLRMGSAARTREERQALVEELQSLKVRQLDGGVAAEEVAALEARIAALEEREDEQRTLFESGDGTRVRFITPRPIGTPRAELDRELEAEQEPPTPPKPLLTGFLTAATVLSMGALVALAVGLALPS